MIGRNELKSYKHLFNEHTDLRYQEMIRCRVRLQNGELVPAQNYYNTSSGISAMVSMDGIRGFASDAGAEAAAVRRVLEKAERNAKLLHGAVKPERKPLLRLENGDYETDYVMRPVDRAYMIDLAREMEGHIAAKYPALKNRDVLVTCDSIEKNSVTTNGCDARTLMIRTHLALILTAECPDGETVTIDDYWGWRGYPEEVFAQREGMYRWADRFCEDVILKSQGVHPEAGLKDIILCPDMAGMLAHEAVGHTCEADMVMGGGAAAYCMDKPVASELVTMVDYAHHAFGRELDIPIYVDDEGVRGRDAMLIDHGILRGYMHDRASAAHFNVAPTGNARAYDYCDEPLIRMRNTIIMPGESALEDMISAIDDGYILSYPANGQGDSTGEFMFGAGLGVEIKRGKLARPVRGVTISGIAFELLKSVDMVSRDLTLRSGGMCGKKQLIQNSMGGPAIKCRANVAGR